MSEVADLGGTWRAAVAEGDLAKEFGAPGFDDAAWTSVDVPGHWRSQPELASTDGPVLHRRRFDLSGPPSGRRRFLELDGVFYYGDVWFDGAYLGTTEGYFVPHAFEITDALAARDDHVLAVEVGCPPQRDPTRKRLVTGVFSHWDVLDPDWNPGGIWRPVRVRETGPVRIAALRVRCRDVTEAQGRLRVDVTVDAGAVAPAPERARLVATVSGPDGATLARLERDLELAAGENHLALNLAVEDPPRWWPWRLGDQPRCTLAVVLEVGGAVSDRATRLTAFREVRLEDWTFVVNGERLFVKGTNHGPTRMALAEATPDELVRDVRLARAANLDLMRIHAHVTRPELYEAADAEGMLIWQDFPLQWGYARGVRRQATRQARVMVEELAHHPSVVIWCAHNEPLALDVPTGAPIGAGTAAKLAASMALPTWTKQVLDRSVARVLRRADGSRPVVRHSGVLPGPTSTGTDSHLYFGWYHGEMADLAPALRHFPRLARFVSELGAQAVPDDAAFCEPQRWPDLDWDRLFERHGLQRHRFDRYVPPAEYATFAAWAAATQEYQAALLQLQVEDLRRLQYRPTGGFCQFCLADGHPAVTWSVLDHRRRPKIGYHALRDACRPVLGMLEPRLGLVHVVSEHRTALDGVEVTVTIGDAPPRRFRGDVPPDGVAFVGRTAIGDARRAEVAVEHPDVGVVVNRYRDLVLDAGRGPAPDGRPSEPQG